MFTLTIWCCICGEKQEQEIDSKFRTRYDSVDEEYGFCEKHTECADFLDAVCPGCVGSFGDCSLCQIFYERTPDLTAAEYELMESGRCPKRTNGTFMLGPRGREDIDLSEKSTHGVAMANALREYVKRFPRKETY